jgi:hypothetical protein
MIAVASKLCCQFIFETQTIQRTFVVIPDALA